MENMKTPFLSACGRSVLIVLLAWHIQLAAAVPVLAQQGPEQTLQEAPVEEDTTLMPPSAGEPEAAPTQADGVEAAVPGAGEQVPGTPFFDDVFDAPVEHNLSVWGMFLMADRVVRGVMIGLVLASLVTWTVWIAKALELIRAKRRARHALDRIVAAKSLADAADALGTKAGPAVLLVRAAEHEIAMTNAMPSHGEAAGLKERVSSHLSRIEAQAGRRMTRGTGILATIGSTAPFVGLFGTVWGIMNAFIGIAEAQTTNLAIVAPGIAEALLATALGLVAAIPAVVIYNGFARSISGYRLLLGDALAAVERLVSREFDHRPAMGPGTAPHA